MINFDQQLHILIDAALKEDIGNGDHSTIATISPDARGKAVLKIKQEGILAGVDVAEKIFRYKEPTALFISYKKDGDEMKVGEIAFEVTGKVHTILQCERLILNCMQRMSGIATKANALLQLIDGTHARLLDTRKTTPNLRMLEKWAVRIGGGFNHRIGLYDMIMLKDNHIDMAGGIGPAIIRTKEYLRTLNKKLRIKIETRSLAEVQEVIDTGGVDIVMLDNMSPVEMRSAVDLINGRFLTEASGGINEETIRDVAESGVDFISVGALTHSVSSMDLSLKAF